MVTRAFIGLLLYWMPLHAWPSSNTELLESLCQDYYAWEYQKDPSFFGAPMREVADTSFIALKKQAAMAGGFLIRLSEIERKALRFHDVVTYDLLREQLKDIVEAPQFYWLVFDVLPYQAGYTLNKAHTAAQSSSFKTAGDFTAYLTLMESYTAYLKQLLSKIKAQEEMGIKLPKQAVPPVIQMFEAARQAAPDQFIVAMDRLTPLSAGEAAETFWQQINAHVNESMVSAFDDLLKWLARYEKRAPQTVGLWQYPDGTRYYLNRIRHYTTMDLMPEAIHELGKQQVAQIAQEMAAVRKELGFTGTQAEFHSMLRKDPRFIAQTPEDVAARFDTYIKRIEPKVDQFFNRKPKAPYGTKRLDPAAEAGMTFGFYQKPSSSQAKGLYRFNGSNLSERPMLWAAPLIYHELIPGHHFHLALQGENTRLNTFRANMVYVTIYTEGWANYAAWLAGEMGMYTDPYDRYGWLVFDMFDTVRLVVDTGMNHLKWPLDQARAYMARHTFQTESEINSETLRYSTDLPGQALAYAMGMERIRALRLKATKAMGDQFDIRTFHDAVLEGGAMTMPLLAERIDIYIQTGR